MNRCIRVLQTHALPLGYCAIPSLSPLDFLKPGYHTVMLIFYSYIQESIPDFSAYVKSFRALFLLSGKYSADQMETHFCLRGDPPGTFSIRKNLLCTGCLSAAVLRISAAFYLISRISTSLHSTRELFRNSRQSQSHIPYCCK